jgi:hypothetical protein
MHKLNVSIVINNQNIEIKPSLYTGAEIQNLVNLCNEERIFLDLENDVDIPISASDLLVIEGGEVFSVGTSDAPDNPNLINSKKVTINGQIIEEVSSAKIKGQLLKKYLSEDISDKVIYLELANTPDYLLKDEESIILNDSLKFLFVTKSNSDEDVPDLEDCACSNHCPPKHQKYKIKVDKVKHKVESPRLTGREILELAGYDETRYLYQKFAGGERRQIELDEKVDFTEPGIERFHTMRCEHQEGLQEPRRQFQLSNDDAEFLDSLNLKWECVVEGNIKRVVIKGFKLPTGFNVSEVEVNMQISSSYPSSQIDMAYFYPAIARTDGKSIRALSSDTFDGKVWQRWSRHRTAQNPWESGVDCIATHVAYIGSWFSQELNK